LKATARMNHWNARLRNCQAEFCLQMSTHVSVETTQRSANPVDHPPSPDLYTSTFGMAHADEQWALETCSCQMALIVVDTNINVHMYTYACAHALKMYTHVCMYNTCMHKDAHA
jgi:hypothetical protein